MKRFRPTVRLRLTLLYGGLFLVAGIALLVVNYTLVEQSIRPRFAEPPPGIAAELGIEVPDERFPGGRRPIASGEQITVDGQSFADVIAEIESQIREDTLDQLVTQSVLALALTGAAAVGLGWLVAGRVLRPIHQITQTARRASDSNLDERVNLSGPTDELKELADTFDRMLERLEAAFKSQKQFAAQVSHELRTPLSIMRAESDVTFGEEHISERERELATIMRDTAERTEQIIDSLLVLARSESRLHTVAPVDLSEIVGDVLGEQAQQADWKGIDLDVDLNDAVVMGERVLLERLVSNLIENAIVHNQPGRDDRAWLRVAVRGDERGAVLSVSNSGPQLTTEESNNLFEPFYRGSAARYGSGLGLTIARAVVLSHDGQIGIEPLEAGGVTVTVWLPLLSQLTI